MRIRIDVSLFDSPTSAFGNVTGYLEMPNEPKVGDYINLAGHDFLVEHVTPYEYINNQGILLERGITIGLDDLVLISRGEAKEFVARLERETELACNEYE